MDPDPPVISVPSSDPSCTPDPDIDAPPDYTIVCDIGDDGVSRTWLVPPAGGNDRPNEVAPVAWEDIASFAAQGGHVTTELAHVIFTGTETNFISSARQHIVQGELRGQNARVRFTPVAWSWDYGDGSKRTTTTPGSTWAALGLDEFARTPTSHVFEARGDYTIRTSVSIRAEYSLDDGAWTPIAGTLTIPSDTIPMTAYTARTVLVADDCTENPDGPGC